jgi:hypothetical protein
MAEFSSMARSVVESFAANLGLDARPASDGSYSFVFARSGTVTLTPTADGRRAVISVARRPQRLDADGELRFLGLAGLDPTTSRPIHCGIAPDGSLVVAASLPEGQFDLPRLDSCLQSLFALQDRAA